MPDLETRMPELLRRAAGGPQRDPGFERRVLRRARRRRVLNASVAGVASVALVAGVVLGVRELAPAGRTTPSEPTESPSAGTVTRTIPLPDAVWPEVTEEALAASQAQADVGAIAWRLDPQQTAVAFATGVLDWDANDVEVRPLQFLSGPLDIAVVTVANAGLEPAEGTEGPAAPETAIMIRRLGDTSDRGIWSVVGAETDLIDLDPIVREPASGPIFSGRLTEDFVEWTPGVWAVDAAGLRLDGDRGFTRAADRTFRVWLEVPSALVPGPAPTASIGVVIGLFDPEGTIVAAEAFQANVSATAGPAPTGSVGPSGATGPTQPIDGLLPSTVLATHDQIAIAAEMHDLDALEALIDPDRFSYNFDDGSNPVPTWREDPTVLDTLAAILQMPFTTNADVYPDLAEGSERVYLWPSLMGSELTDLTAQEQDMLGALGITERDVQDMLDAFGGYVGPRTGIAENGTWVFFVIGGD